jgi:PPOX class probable F420-dependent enzyme
MLEPEVKSYAQVRNFGTITTLLKDGSPVTHVMWVDADDEHILINTEIHRSKYKNIQRDPRASVVVWDAADPYNYVEVRGRVIDEIRGPEARAHIDELSLRYDGKPYDDASITSERVILKIKPERQRGY